jgi:ribonuclease P protein component
MHPKNSHRLRRSEDFAQLKAEGRTTKHPLLMMSWRENGLLHSRYAVITPKHLGNAVQRNRIRRQVKEIIRHLYPRLYGGFDVVVIVRQRAMDASFGMTSSTLNDLFNRAGLLTKDDL